MENILNISLRDSKGSSNSKRLRKSGFVPANIYAAGKSDSVQLETREFVNLAKKCKTSSVFSFKSDDKELDGRSAIVKEIQRDYINGEVLHVDFLSFKEGRRVKIQVPIDVEGEAAGVKEGGVLTLSARYVTVKTLAEDIPSSITADASHLSIGDRLRTGDVKLPKGVTLVGRGLETVASVVSSRTSATADDEAADAEIASEASAAAAEGAEKAEKADK